MDDSQTLIFALGSLLGTLGQLAVIIACIILVSKRKNTATILMLVGSVLGLVFTVLNLSGNILAANGGVESLMTWTKIFALLGPLPYILFGIGLLFYAISFVKKGNG
ncbi:hypothetical protein [Flagellimonas flava]|uniref:Uncharacterized protein n=1 Tax=Flagellimonas flava TaxID=570519 RepID=A0A1M5I8M0_9FLAO|nr:hypothetical protein [Allomuricauda flava]SHG24469.1 hypothetical protein SAMN04488116_0513 [Allomuricauda flava]